MVQWMERFEWEDRDWCISPGGDRTRSEVEPCELSLSNVNGVLPKERVASAEWSVAKRRRKGPLRSDRGPFGSRLRFSRHATFPTLPFPVLWQPYSVSQQIAVAMEVEERLVESVREEKVLYDPSDKK